MNEWMFENSDEQKQEAGKSPSLKNKTEFAVLADRLRLVTKYRVFDLEATRRENSRLRKLLEGDDDREIP